MREVPCVLAPAANRFNRQVGAVAVDAAYHHPEIVFLDPRERTDRRTARATSRCQNLPLGLDGDADVRVVDHCQLSQEPTVGASSLDRKRPLRRSGWHDVQIDSLIDPVSAAKAVEAG